MRPIDGALGDGIAMQESSKESASSHGELAARTGCESTGDSTGDSTGEPACVHLNSDSLHDLFGPASQLHSLLELILRKPRPGLDKEDEALLGFLREASGRLQTLLTALRTYMQVVGRDEPHRALDANQALASALAELQPAIERSGAQITSDPLPDVFGDPEQITYTFARLLENSIKFRSESRPEIHISATRDGNDWLFSVRDNGIGIDPSQNQRIFGVFRRIHQNVFPGAGIGLAIAKGIIERHGGGIWVDSRLGQGATFRFTLPLAAGGQPGQAATR